MTNAATIPAATLGKPKLFWRTVMETYYGPYNKKLKCWKAVIEGQAVCMRPHKMAEADVNGTRNIFVVVGGSAIGDDGVPDTSHAAGGVMGLILFKDDGAALSEVARNDLHTSIGTFGEVPGEDAFQLREIGPSRTFGWVVSAGFMGQGITISSSFVFAPIGDRFVEIGRLPEHYDDKGNCDENGKSLTDGTACSDYSTTILFDPAGQNSRFYPIVLKLTGTRQGKQLDQTFTVKFDDVKKAYGKPENFPPEFDF